MDLEEFRRQAKSKRKENKKFFRRLKTVKPKVLDQHFHEEHERAFQHINCLECANCCKTTGPLFTDRDVNRISKAFGLKASEFEAKYLRRDEDDDLVLQQLPCPFLGDDNYCSIYDIRPKACREFPHTDRNKIHQILGITQKNAEGCPAVFEIVENLKKQL